MRLLLDTIKMHYTTTHLLYCLVIYIGNTVGAPADYKLPTVNITTAAEINALHYSNDRISDGVEDTVKEVEDLLNKNANLPRLTRGEILDILDNITKSDKAKMKTRHGDERAIMVVMPYSSENGNEQELYTKPPITHIIGDVEENKNLTKKPYSRRYTTTKKPDIVKPTVSQKSYTRRRYRKTTTTLPSTSSVLDTTTTTTQTPFRTKTKFISTTKALKHTTVTPEFKPITSKTSTSFVKYPNHKYPDELVDEPTFFKAPPIQTTTKQLIVTTNRPINKQSLQNQNSTLSEHFHLPDNLKDVVKDLDFLIRNNPNKFNDDFIPLPDHSNKYINEDNLKELLTANKQQQIKHTTITPDLSKVADNLTPEMRELLMNFGLIPDPNQKQLSPEINQSPSLEPNSEIKPDSYLSFKPLPQINENINNNNDMSELLARFGLGRSQQFNNQTPNESDKFKAIIGDINLTKDTFKGAGFKPQPTTHVFNPSDTQRATKDEIDKLNQLLGVIKQLEKINGTATADDLKTIDLEHLKEIVAGLNGDPFVPLDEQIAPKPESDSFDFNKNEIKRETSTVVNADLEDSFGGSVSTEILPQEPPKRTGFYYLVDWNSFFDIDNQKGKRVNLRFQPKIGDPKRFLSVSVP